MRCCLVVMLKISPRERRKNDNLLLPSHYKQSQMIHAAKCVCLRSLILCGFCMHLRFKISITSSSLSLSLSLYRAKSKSQMWQNNKARINANEFKAQFGMKRSNKHKKSTFYVNDISIMVNGYM
jgi:hypothetical protein